VVTSTDVGKVFLDFTVNELSGGEVLVNRSPRHISERVFAERQQKLCTP